MLQPPRAGPLRLPVSVRLLAERARAVGAEPFYLLVDLAVRAVAFLVGFGRLATTAADQIRVGGHRASSLGSPGCGPSAIAATRMRAACWNVYAGSMGTRIVISSSIV